MQEAHIDLFFDFSSALPADEMRRNRRNRQRFSPNQYEGGRSEEIPFEKPFRDLN